MLLRPGVTCEKAIKFLDDLVQGGLNDVRNSVPHFAQPTLAGVEPSKLAGPDLVVTLRQYAQWTATTARQLAGVFADPAVPARLRGEHYSHIVHSSLTPYRTTLLVHWELDELATYFMELQNRMRQTVEDYRSYRQRVLVVDTNTLLHCQRFDKIPWSRVCGKGPATLVIPHVVVEEIDTKSYSEGSEKIRKRARGVYELLGDVLKGLSPQRPLRTARRHRGSGPTRRAWAPTPAEQRRRSRGPRGPPAAGHRTAPDHRHHARQRDARQGHDLVPALGLSTGQVPDPRGRLRYWAPRGEPCEHQRRRPRGR
ncbi:PIN domain-containing protein [Streptomyces himastatinicus]|nr:PIN domain-containing protein [Streptomyces himastatinicus]